MTILAQTAVPPVLYHAYPELFENGGMSQLPPLEYLTFSDISKQAK